MPRVNGNQWRRCRAKLDMTSDAAATQLGIAGGALRSIELDLKPASWRLAFRAAGLYKCDVDLLLANDEGTPDEPPSKTQEQEVNTGPGRKETEKRTGPKRLTGRTGAAA